MLISTEFLTPAHIVDALDEHIIGQKSRETIGCHCVT